MIFITWFPAWVLGTGIIYSTISAYLLHQCIRTSGSYSSYYVPYRPFG